jgi:hypothetical protein
MPRGDVKVDRASCLAVWPEYRELIFEVLKENGIEKQK